MKILAMIAAAVVLAVAASAQTPMAAQLAAMKQQFPSHVVGPVTDRSDPAVVQCFRRHKRLCAGLRADNLALDLQRWKDEIAREIREIEWRLERPRERITSSSRWAEEKNLSWLKQKLTPYVRRIEQMQRGR